MLSQYTRDLIRKNAEAQALEKSGAKVEVKETKSVEVSEPIVETVKEESTKKTDAEKLKKKKD